MLNSKKQTRINHIVTCFSLALFSIYCLFPFVWMVISALKPKAEIRTANPTFYIKNATFENFTKVLFDTGFVGFMKNSLVVSVFSTLISLAIAIFAGYALSRYSRQQYVKVTHIGMLVSQMVPGVLLLVPLYLIMQKFKLLDSYYSLILAYTTFVIPLCTFMMSSFFDTIPYSLEEAAEVDGCGKLKTIFTIIIPVSIPSIISTGLYAFISAWNEFMFGYTFISVDKFKTITPAIMLYRGANITDWGGLMATSVLAVLPVTVIFLFLQKYYMSGLLSGSVKG